jgi:uncharacterized RDD family membrane protein YckC
MKTIDIQTTQNVTITYELASLTDRLLAFILDSVFKTCAILLLVLIFSIFRIDRWFQESEIFFVILVIFPIITFYTLCFELWYNGQTPGKMILKIKVAKMDGRQPVFYDHLLRWSFRIIDLALTGGVLGSILISSTDYSQRLGDIVTNTTLVKVTSRLTITLSDILNIETRNNYEPIYPAIGNFREEDILLIKQTIDRYHRYANEAHFKAIVELGNTLKEKLEIKDINGDYVAFLKTLIKDYIVLTR